MSSNPSKPTPKWPASSEPLDALPADDGFQAPSERFHTGPPDPFGTGPQDREPTAATGPPDPADERLAMLSYLAVPFLGPVVPLAIYLVNGRSPGYLHRHASQALDLSITTLLYTICALILGAMLALDSIVLALVIVVPLAIALWLVTLAYVIVAAASANRGDYYPIPSWICASLAH